MPPKRCCQALATALQWDADTEPEDIGRFAHGALGCPEEIAGAVVQALKVSLLADAMPKTTCTSNIPRATGQWQALATVRLTVLHFPTDHLRSHLFEKCK
jgi:hypothetical protein